MASGLRRAARRAWLALVRAARGDRAHVVAGAERLVVLLDTRTAPRMLAVPWAGVDALDAWLQAQPPDAPLDVPGRDGRRFVVPAHLTAAVQRGVAAARAERAAWGREGAPC